MRQHGTRSCYKGGCKCEPCRQANRAYIRRMGMFGHGTTLVDASRAREHVLMLQQAGLGRREIARRSGVSDTIVGRLLGQSHEKPARRVRPETQERLLAVQPDRLADHALVPILGSQRRLQALVAMGWTQSYLADRIGWSVANLTALTNGRREFIVQRTATLIEQVYEELSMTHGPSRRAMNHAENKGWPPPLAWDDIDDPDEVAVRRGPDSKNRDLEALMEDYEDTFWQHGGDLRAAALRLEISEDALSRAIYRARERGIAA